MKTALPEPTDLEKYTPQCWVEWKREKRERWRGVGRNVCDRWWYVVHTPSILPSRQRVSLGNYGVGVFLCVHDLDNMMSESCAVHPGSSSLSLLRSNTVCCECHQLSSWTCFVTLLGSSVKHWRNKSSALTLGMEVGSSVAFRLHNRTNSKQGGLVTVHWRWEDSRYIVEKIDQ